MDVTKDVIIKDMVNKDVINKEFEDRLGVKIGYVSVVCSTCGNSWGVRLWNTYLKKDVEPRLTDFICRVCAMKKIAESQAEYTCISSKNG
jgi:hypothetical protein